MKKIRELLGYLPWILILTGGITYSIYYHKWILLALIIVGLVVFGGFIYILGMSLESAFRNKYPLDYLMQLTTEINFFNEKGFQQIDYIDPGSEHPGVLMQNENLSHIRIILNAPIRLSKHTVDVCNMENPEACIHYDAGTDQETKLEKLKALYERMSVLNTDDNSTLLTEC